MCVYVCTIVTVACDNSHVMSTIVTVALLQDILHNLCVRESVHVFERVKEQACASVCGRESESKRERERERE